MAKQQSGGVQTLEKIVSLAKRRGFVFQSSEIYGGLNGCWDYGPLGVELLRNVKEAWWKSMTLRDDVEGLDASILMHPRVWEASGHVAQFSDPMIDCKSCKARFRLDHFIEEMSEKKLKDFRKAMNSEIIRGMMLIPEQNMSEIQRGLEGTYQSRLDHINALTEKEEIANAISTILEYYRGITGEKPLFQLLVEYENIVCPNCGTKQSLTPPRYFNLMFETHLGSISDESSKIYLRPETAQGIFVNMLNVMQSSRQRLPFGIAQIGKAFRNEINTKNFLFRTREFEQMEMQYFVKEGTDDKFFDEWRENRLNWWVKLGIAKEKLRLKPHEKLAHYARAAVDVEFEFPFGFGEIEGVHNRTNFDLRRHQDFSTKSLSIHDEETKEKIIPYVIETSAGASRGFMAFLCNAYNEEEVNGEVRTVLRFHPYLAPIKAAILPLVNKDGMPEIAEKLTKDLQRSMKVFYDDSGAVGRRYRRQDEIGTPFGITIDSDTLSDQTVTIRERDSMEQIRLPIEKVKGYLLEKLECPV